jgi:hypothetical protein
LPSNNLLILSSLSPIKGISTCLIGMVFDSPKMLKECRDIFIIYLCLITRNHFFVYL